MWAELSNPGFVRDPAGSPAGLGSITGVQSLALGIKLSHQEEGGAGKGPHYHLVRRETAIQFNEGKRHFSDVTVL